MTYKERLGDGWKNKEGPMVNDGLRREKIRHNSVI